MVPGAFNGMVGRVAASKEYKALYISGAAVTASSGVPDIGLLSMESFTKVISEVYNSSGLPIIADADTGFGKSSRAHIRSPSCR